jgi:hypothetical protein
MKILREPLARKGTAFPHCAAAEPQGYLLLIDALDQTGLVDCFNEQG